MAKTMTGEGIQSANKRAQSAWPLQCRVRFLLTILGAATFLVLCGVSGHAQGRPMGGNTPVGGVPGYPQQSGPMLPPDGMDGVGSLEAERRLNALNDERQKALIADTAKLLKLATALNEQIAKSNPGQLTPDQMRMVAEMEKLARSVRDKMAMSLRGPQYPGGDTITQPFPPSHPH